MAHCRSIMYISLMALLFCLLGQKDVIAAGMESGTATQDVWRIRFLDAAVVQGDNVRLGEIAVPVGAIPAGKWEEISQRELWPSPPKVGKAVNMTRPRLQEAVMKTMRDLAPYCLFPGSMALQRGGVLVNKEAIQSMVENELRPHLGTLPGEGMLKDFRLPQYVFMEHAGQNLTLDPIKKLTPGRQSLRLSVKEMDGQVKQKLTGSVMVDCWMNVPCAATALNRDDLLDVSKVTFRRMNLATLRGEPWDGRGGALRLTRPIGVDQVIYKQDVTHVPTIRKGTIITLLYEGSAVRLSLQAEALADGVTGETIPVRNLQSKKEVYGLIRDSSTVLVRSN